MEVERAMGQSVDVAMVHGEKHLPGLDRGADSSPGFDLATAGLDLDPIVGGKIEGFGVPGVNLQPEVGGVKLFENCGLAGAGFRMPLGT